MKCYTIGHSTRTLDEFIKVLQEYRIDSIIDIRSNPTLTNVYTKHFSKDSLEKSLVCNQIKYLYLGKELGEVRKDGRALDEKVNVDFNDVIECNLFKKGIYEIIERLSNKERIAILCSERNPLNCHRSILVGYTLSKNGVLVEHIIDKDKTKSQARMDEEIFLMYEPKCRDKLIEISMQEVLTSDDYDDISAKEVKRNLIEKGYRMRWIEITSRKKY